MDPIFETQDLWKWFGGTLALSRVSLSLRNPSIVGLVGRNGSGKTTLIGLMVGLLLPTEGIARTLGRATHMLGRTELEQIGYVPDNPVLLHWMTVTQQLDYVASFYPRWDRERERALCGQLELARQVKVSALSAGDLQKLAIVLSICHHPKFIALDEPLSHLDPIVREQFLRFLLDLVAEDGATVVMSSHVLNDVERIVDWVVCLDGGTVVADAALDDLKGEYAEWQIVARNGGLPARFPEAFVLHQDVSSPMARLVVRASEAERMSFESAHHVTVTATPLNLGGMFPYLLKRNVQ